MLSHLKNIVIDAIDSSIDKYLYIGENSIFLDYQNYTVIIEYFLDDYGAELILNVNKVLVTNNTDNTEYIYTSLEDVRDILLDSYDTIKWDDITDECKCEEDDFN